MLAAILGVVLHFRKHHMAAAMLHDGVVAEIEMADRSRNTMGMLENPLAAARRAKAAAEQRAAHAAAAPAAQAPPPPAPPAPPQQVVARKVSSEPSNTVVNAMYAFEAPDYATIDEPTCAAYLATLAGGNIEAIYSTLAMFGQIPKSNPIYASFIETANETQNADDLYNKASAYQLETVDRDIYMQTRMSKLTDAQKMEQHTTAVQAMSVHHAKYDALFASWVGELWVDDLDMQHTIVLRGFAAKLVVQPHPWSSDKDIKVTSKRYMLKVLDVYSQTASTSPVNVVAAACRRIAAKLGVKAVSFELGPTKTQTRIFEKVLANKGRFDLIRDYARAAFVVHDVTMFPRLLQMLLIDNDFKVVRAKNRLSTTWDSRDSAGYIDYQVLVQTKEGWIVELQLIPAAMHALKISLGHTEYVQFRFIIEAVRRSAFMIGGGGSGATGNDESC